MTPTIQTIMASVASRLEASRPSREARAKSVAVAGLTPEEAYMLGRTEGFFEGVISLLKSGLVRLVRAGPSLPRGMRSLMEQVH